jgi:ornithine carbamoyltransferase
MKPAPERAPRRVRPVPPPDLVRDDDFSSAGVAALFDLAADVKARPKRYARELAGRSLAVLFEKRSLRTRLTFELAMKSLGGDSVFMDSGPQRIPDREPIKDIARNLERWVDGVALRTFEHETVEEFARWARIPVVNGLSEKFHPCQALTDLFTLSEAFGRGAVAAGQVKLAFVGDGNNVCHSLLLTGATCGAHVAVATPAGYEPDAGIVARAREIAAETGARIEIHSGDAGAAVAGARAIYTDVWASMGHEHEAADRAQVFAPFQVNAALLEAARPDAVFMHCLPAHRDEEVTDEVIESPRSVVFEQAENRLHIAKAILLTLIAG